MHALLVVILTVWILGTLLVVLCALRGAANAERLAQRHLQERRVALAAGDTVPRRVCEPGEGGLARCPGCGAAAGQYHAAGCSLAGFEDLARTAETKSRPKAAVSRTA